MQAIHERSETMPLKFIRLSAALLALLFSTALLASQAFWIDVRTPEEYAADHVTGAVNIPYDQISGRIDEVTGNKDAEIYLYCRTGHRAGIARETLERAGYTHVTNLGGLENAKAVAEKAAGD